MTTAYLDLVRRCLHAGVQKSDRTGTGTRSVFGRQMRFDLALGFPLVTAKRVPFKSTAAELLWFLSGSTRVQDLRDLGSTIWDEWEKPDGTIGPMYGEQWRDFDNIGRKGLGIDQIKNLVRSLRSDPDSRRHVVSAWNPGDIPHMALAPCHAMFQCYTETLSVSERSSIFEDTYAPTSEEYKQYENTRMSQLAAFHDAVGTPSRRLSLQVYQRSADIFLGVPFNIASYALLTHMLAQQCGYEVGELIWTGGDCHLYSNHVEQAKEMLSRDSRPRPALTIRRKPDTIFDYRPDDFELIGYDPHPTISAPVAV